MKRLFALSSVLPMPALAHTGDHSHVPPTHALTSVDHLAVLITVVVVAGLAATIWARR